MRFGATTAGPWPVTADRPTARSVSRGGTPTSHRAQRGSGASGSVSIGTSGRGSRRAREVGPAAALELVELGERGVEVAAALLEVAAALVDLVQDVLELAAPAARRVVEVD